MLSPRSCVSPYLGRGPVREMSLPNEWGQAPFVPQGHSSEGGPGPPGQGCPPLMGCPSPTAHGPLSEGGGWRRAAAWSCHCWSKRERAARDRELSVSEFIQETRKTETGWGGGGKPPGVGQSRRQPDRTGPRPQRSPRASQRRSTAPGTSVTPLPPPLSGLRQRPWGAGGGSALPREWTHGRGGGNWRGTQGDYLPEE